MSIAAHPINAVTPSPNAVGNSSIGQYILGSVINGTAGANATGASNTINPILAFKNIGDNALAITQALYVAKKLYDNAPGTPGSGVTGKITSTVAGAGTWVVSKIPGVGTIVDTIKSIAQDMSGVLPMVLIVLFATACTMSIYIPMIPFIQWFAALLQWFTSVIESLIGSSLWALAHFDAEGEGMGQRASYGYLYMLNNFARPIIQTFAFFVASGAITVMGTFLFKYYMTAVASAQGSSLTGLISIAGYLVIFAIMGVALVNNSFNMMLHLADRMIGWIGQNAAAAIGHDVENRVNGIFINAARMGSQMMRPAVNSTAGNLVGEVEGATSR
jgi:conjugal transfer/type IV secretion protein DotA/TraY